MKNGGAWRCMEVRGGEWRCWSGLEAMEVQEGKSAMESGGHTRARWRRDAWVTGGEEW